MVVVQPLSWLTPFMVLLADNPVHTHPYAHVHMSDDTRTTLASAFLALSSPLCSCRFTSAAPPPLPARASRCRAMQSALRLSAPRCSGVCLRAARATPVVAVVRWVVAGSVAVDLQAGDSAAAAGSAARGAARAASRGQPCRWPACPHRRAPPLSSHQPRQSRLQWQCRPPERSAGPCCSWCATLVFRFDQERPRLIFDSDSCAARLYTSR